MPQIRPVYMGVAASGFLLAVYFGLVTAVSGWTFTADQFADYWYFIVPLALGFGIQVGLYGRLRELAGARGASKKLVAASGTTSTAAMISCCTHYLANVLPVLGATGFVTVISQYQIQFFWLGLAFNLLGILYIAPKVIKASREARRA